MESNLKGSMELELEVPSTELASGTTGTDAEINMSGVKPISKVVSSSRVGAPRWPPSALCCFQLAARVERLNAMQHCASRSARCHSVQRGEGKGGVHARCMLSALRPGQLGRDARAAQAPATGRLADRCCR